MFFPRPPHIIRSLFPELVWTLPAPAGEVYFTFDDGPDPEGTPRILDWLAEHDAKATFFCLGRQVERYPSLFDRIRREGHAVGNHTWSHPSGWTTPNKKYFEDIERAGAIIGSPLFRPPYGRIRPSQIRHLKEKYSIILWDVMSGDHSPRQSPGKISRRLQKQVGPGSIVVAHDRSYGIFLSLDNLRFISRAIQYGRSNKAKGRHPKKEPGDKKQDTSNEL